MVNWNFGQVRASMEEKCDAVATHRKIGGVEKKMKFTVFLKDGLELGYVTPAGIALEWPEPIHLWDDLVVRAKPPLLFL